jgi:hypothetical protein
VEDARLGIHLPVRTVLWLLPARPAPRFFITDATHRLRQGASLWRVGVAAVLYWCVPCDPSLLILVGLNAHGPSLRAEFVVQLDVFKNSFFGILTLILYQLVRVIILKVPPPTPSTEPLRHELTAQPCRSRSCSPSTTSCPASRN